MIDLFYHARSFFPETDIYHRICTVLKRFSLVKSNLVLLIILFVGDLGFAMEWPDESERILSTFGAAGNRHFQRGLAFESEGQLISSWEAGEVIWTNDAQGRIPFRGTIVVEHQNGFRSVYLGVERLYNLEFELAEGQLLGYARGETWRFEIVDAERHKLVNPIFILPVRSGVLQFTTGTLEILMPDETNFVMIQDGLVLSAGYQTIIINDVFPKGDGAAPATISLYWIGQRIAEFRINALRESEDGIVLETPKPLSYELVFNANGQIWFSGIRLNEGRGELELRIEDEASRVFIKRWNISAR